MFHILSIHNQVDEHETIFLTYGQFKNNIEKKNIDNTSLEANLIEMNILVLFCSTQDLYFFLLRNNNEQHCVLVEELLVN